MLDILTSDSSKMGVKYYHGLVEGERQIRVSLWEKERRMTVNKMPFYSDANSELILVATNEITMVDRNQYANHTYDVYQLNLENQMKEVIYLEYWLPVEFNGLLENACQKISPEGVSMEIAL